MALRAPHETSPYRHQTAWFRDGWPFEVLERELARINGTVRIVSAGCSTGEEAYGAAMVLLRARRPGSVLGLDIAPGVLEEARQGAYSSAFPPPWAAPYFGPERVGLLARERVAFAQADLRRPWPCSQVHVVFLRNVLRYFYGAARGHIIAGARAALLPGGLLILGSDAPERKVDLGEGFQRVEREAFRLG